MTTTPFPQTWDLASLAPAPGTPEFRQQLEQFKARLQVLADSTNRLAPATTEPQHVKAWSQLISEYEAVDALATDYRAFIDCQAAADAENQTYRQLQAELAATTPAREQIATSIEFALRDAAEADFLKFIDADPVLTRNRYFLITRRKNAALRLPKPQELLAADLAVDGLHGWGRLFDKVSSSLKVQVQEKGKLVTRSPGQVQFDSPQRTVRENNFLALDSAWSTISDTCAEAINHIAGSRLTTYRHIGLRDHLEAPLRANRMTRETLDTMWATITANKGVLKTYFEKKAQLIGVERLAWYDQWAPLPQLPGTGNTDNISYDQACEWIIDAFQEFSPDLGDFAKMALSDRWVEAENRSGKQQGGFCTVFPTAQQSRIFMTYTNSADSMSTLAHELGHAYHSWVLRDESVFLQDYPMNLAETASTFAEAVLGEQRLQRAASDYERLQMLDGMIGDAVAFLMNIHARFLFEDEFHRQRKNGELTSTQLSQLMEQAQRTAYLGLLSDDGWNPRFWVSKLHFYITSLPFYNFPYTFGYLLSLGVYAIGKESKGDFPKQYRELLLATGCQDAEEAVQSTMGFDLRKPDFWQKSLNIVADRVKQFVTIADQVLQKTGQL
ncbi:M3 family oligoendopeptidase [Schlesneria paludicola]|uniref:M3 family oligoendopeptidase n=1 Tax=Schlesneria paludicola TaxID=360056 RepID=UPI00029AD494|nr:M3 family oligoendopeptidase [Schlesneria paludicola]